MSLSINKLAKSDKKGTLLAKTNKNCARDWNHFNPRNQLFIASVCQICVAVEKDLESMLLCFASYRFLPIATNIKI
jgi:hypothetical protein